jgi:heme/copper-type cytochrome/quinol oxidase subunit 3
MLLDNLKRQRMILYLIFMAATAIIFVMQMPNNGVVLAQGEAPVNIEQTARNFYDQIKAPLYWISGSALILGAIVFMFARGNPQHTAQARLGLGVAIAGFLIGTFALGIMEFAKGLIS